MKRLRVVIASLVLCGLALFLLCPSIGLSVADVGLRESLPFLPLSLYLIVGLLCWEELQEVPRDEVQASLSIPQAMSLTLTGFCFTSLGFLLSFFKNEITAANPAPQGILYFFAIALACFVTSYMTLRYRNRRLFPFLFDAFMDNGLWCILAGFVVFTRRTPGL